MGSACTPAAASLFRPALLVLCSLGALGCGSGGSGGPGASGGPTGGWEPLGQRFFTGTAANSHSIDATGGAVTVGYWDHSLDKPCVKQYSASSDSWEYVGGGPVPVESLSVDPLAYQSFKFRKAGGLSVVGFNRTLPESDYVLFAADGEGAWQQLPSMPLDLLPGYTAGVTGFVEQDFEFTVKNGVIYALVNDEESTYPDEHTCLSVFTFASGAWTLVPDRVCHPHEVDGFGYEAIYTYPTIEVSESGRIYVGYFKRESANSLTSVGVTMHDGAGWTPLTDSSFYPIGTSSYAISQFGIRVYSTGGQDVLALAVGGIDNAARVFLYRSGAWSELPASGVQAGLGTHLAVAFAGCADCIYLAYKDCCTGLDGVSVKRYVDGAWKGVGEPNFTDFADAFYDDVLAADDGFLYLLFQTNLDVAGEATSGTLSVYRKEL